VIFLAKTAQQSFFKGEAGERSETEEGGFVCLHKHKLDQYQYLSPLRPWGASTIPTGAGLTRAFDVCLFFAGSPVTPP